MARKKSIKTPASKASKKKTSRKQAPKLLARVADAKSARIFRSPLTPAAHLKFLDLDALKAAKKATIEVGVISVAGKNVPVVADIERGMVVALRPTNCESCKPEKGKAPGTPAERKRAAKTALGKVRDMGATSVALPMPVARMFDFIITIGPIIIIWDWDFCIVIDTDFETCFYCVKAGSWCLSKAP